MASSRNRSSTDLAQSVASSLRRHVLPQQSLVVGLSGGVDSVVLLHVLHKLQPQFGYRLAALHVNHGLSANADAWQAFCADMCEALKLPLAVRRVEVASGTGQGIENAARSARYGAYAQVATDWLALAHQRDDLAETVLHNLLRGAGIRGAAGMPEARPLDAATREGARVLRPLLGVSRAEIEAWGRSHALRWIEDESNLDMRYTRNFLRRDVLPLLRRRFPGCEEALARAAGLFAESDALLEALAEVDRADATPDGRLSAAKLRELAPARARNVLRYWLIGRGVELPDAAHLTEILRQVVSAGADRSILLPLAGWRLHRYRDELYLVRTSLDAELPSSALAWHGERELAWGATRIAFVPVIGEGICRTRLSQQTVRIDRRRGGECLQPDVRRPRRTLKNLLQEARVPPWERDLMPLLWCGNDLVWVPHVGIAADYFCAPHAPGWRVTWVR